MKSCQQSLNQNIYQHGEAVQKRMLQLIQMLNSNNFEGDWRLPEWLQQYRLQILHNLCSEEIIKEYTLFHDCSKPYCRIMDENGKQHFPNHAEKSYEIWSQIGNHQAAKLMRMDMMIHQLKAVDINDFIQHPEATTLLLAGLAEVHANGEMFGGFDSDSFKIKWNQINKRGKAICKKLFDGDINDVDANSIRR